MRFKPSFVVALLATFGLIGLFLVGLFANQPFGMFGYLCLSPFAFMALGRTSVGLVRRHAALLTDDELRQLGRIQAGRR